MVDDDPSAVDILAGVHHGWKLLEGNCLDILRQLPAGSVQTCVTSPPFLGLRNYQTGDDYVWPDGWRGQLGLEPTAELFIEHLVLIFREVHRVLTDDGTLWLNLGDSYVTEHPQRVREKNMGAHANIPGSHARDAGRTMAGAKGKDLYGIPWSVALALRNDGWWLRADIIWNKPNCSPEVVSERPFKSHEYIFLFAKRRKRYRCNLEGDARRSVWTVPIGSFPGAHFATFPPELPTRCIEASTEPGDLVLDPFSGAATTGEVALKLGRRYIGIEQNRDYIKLAQARLIGAPKAEFKGALIFCPGCEKVGRTKLIETSMIERAKATGRKITCAQCMSRYTVEELVSA